MRGSKVLSWVVLGALVLGVLGMLGLVMYQQGVSETESDAQQVEIAALQAGLKEANARLEARGDAPVPVPEVDDSGETPTVPIAPTQAQILSAFAVWCDLESCHGDDGDDGKDAPPMTQQQIFAGFSEWCATDPRCVGQPGTDGADSTVPGPPGRPPTPEEVLTAVQVVCADGACVGDNGKDGKDGAPGKDAPRVVGVECVTNNLIFRMSEGPAFTAADACISPTPTPTPTASTTKGR